jgi:hypothetical protein
MTAGWMVTVAVFKDDGKFGHITLAVAIADPSEAVNAALRASAGGSGSKSRTCRGAHEEPWPEGGRGSGYTR